MSNNATFIHKRNILYLTGFALVLLACTPTLNDNDSGQTLPFLRLEFIADLPDALEESSGLVSFENFLISHNDRGNKNKLYVIHPTTGEIEREILVSNLTNSDWEDLAEDEKFVYINDAGNNKGDRRDLQLHKLPKNHLQQDNVEGVSIPFFYPKQKTFSPNKQHNFDCEALIACGDSLYLFTKNRGNNMTDIYRISKNPNGVQAAKHITNFVTNCRITGATINEEQNCIVLCGIAKKEQLFLIVLSDVEDCQLHSPSIQQYSIGNFSDFGQIEAVAFHGNDLYLTSEKVKKHNLPPRLYRIPLEWIKK